MSVVSQKRSSFGIRPRERDSVGRPLAERRMPRAKSSHKQNARKAQK